MNHQHAQAPFDESLWIDLLADNELDSEQRRRLLDHLEQHPQFWRSCALTFIDGQTLRTELKMTVGQEPEETSLPLSRNTGRRSRAKQFAVFAASLFLAFAVGRVTSSEFDDTRSQPRQVARETLPHPPEMLHDTENASQLFFASMPSAVPALIEVKDDEQEAVYYLHEPLPSFLLDAIVMAGHGVRAEQEMVEIEFENGEIDVVPINTLIIDKYVLSGKRM